MPSKKSRKFKNTLFELDMAKSLPLSKKNNPGRGGRESPQRLQLWGVFPAVNSISNDGCTQARASQKEFITATEEQLTPCLAAQFCVVCQILVVLHITVRAATTEERIWKQEGRTEGRLISIFLSGINHDYPFFEQYMKVESFDRWDLKFSWGSWYSCCCC